MNHKAFWDAYLSLESEEESRQYLKNYLFSLPPAEMKNWLLNETQSICLDLKKQLLDPTVSELWKQQLKEQIRHTAFNVDQLSPLHEARKAA